LSRQLVVVTPENVEVTFDLAGLGTRFLASLMDYVLVGLVMLALILLLVYAFANLLGLTGTWLVAACILLGFMVDWCYFIGFESGWRGQTPGKRRMGLRVLRAGGFPVDRRAIIIRNFMRAVDFLPGFYSAGVVSIFASSQNQRLGDMAAGTVVVREEAETAEHPLHPQPAPARFPADVVSRLSPDGAELLRGYMGRRQDLDDEVRERIATGLIRLFARQLDLPEAALHPPDASLMSLWSDREAQLAPLEPKGVDLWN
jgi:uncharacterized RDD family membrane protein YckC